MTDQPTTTTQEPPTWQLRPTIEQSNQLSRIWAQLDGQYRKLGRRANRSDVIALLLAEYVRDHPEVK